MTQYLTHHLMVSIKGLEDRLTGRVKKRDGSWQILESNGKLLTLEETWTEVVRAKDKGFDVIPTCDNIDERGHCKGHE